MIDFGAGQWAVSQDFIEAGPRNRASPISTRQPFLPDTHDLIREALESSTVAPDAVIGEVAPHHRGQMAMLVGYRCVSVVPAPFSYRAQRAGETAFGRHLLDLWLALLGAPPHVGEPKEVEAGPIRGRMALIVC